MKNNTVVRRGKVRVSYATYSLRADIHLNKPILVAGYNRNRRKLSVLSTLTTGNFVMLSLDRPVTELAYSDAVGAIEILGGPVFSIAGNSFIGLTAPNPVYITMTTQFGGGFPGIPFELSIVEESYV